MKLFLNDVSILEQVEQGRSVQELINILTDFNAYSWIDYNSNDIDAIEKSRQFVLIDHYNTVLLKLVGMLHTGVKYASIKYRNFENKHYEIPLVVPYDVVEEKHQHKLSGKEEIKLAKEIFHFFVFQVSNVTLDKSTVSDMLNIQQEIIKYSRQDMIIYGNKGLAAVFENISMLINSFANSCMFGKTDEPYILITFDSADITSNYQISFPEKKPSLPGKAKTSKTTAKPAAKKTTAKK